MISNRIGKKLGLIIVAVFLVVLVALGLALDVMFSNFYRTEMTTRVEELAKHMVSMASSPNTTTQEMIKDFAEFSEVSIFYVDGKENIVLHSGRHVPADRSFIQSEEVSSIISGSKVREEYTDDRGQRFFMVGMPVSHGNSPTEALYVLASSSHMESSLRNVRQLLVLAGLGAFLLALGITWLIAQILSRPLLQMQRATRKIAAGELETRLNITSRDEVGSLAESINDMAEHLQRYRDSRQEFFANISHELRTPITYLEGYAKVLKNRMYETDEERDQYLGIIEQESLRLQRLVNDLFELAKMEEGRIDLQPELLEFGEIVEQAVHKMEWRAKEKGLELKLDCHGALPMLRGDGLRMEQIVFNLLDNAISYTEEGSITVTVGRRGNRLLFAVEDTGIGIPENELSLIFERFNRVEKSRSRKYGGTGLGLSIVNKLVELQDGEITVMSTPGAGSRFEVTFPFPSPTEETRGTRQ